MTTQLLDPKLLDILACPACDDRPPLAWNAADNTLDCAQCGRRYPVAEGGIPVLLIDEAIMPEGDEAATPEP